jgi:hypothetical protein
MVKKALIRTAKGPSKTGDAYPTPRPGALARLALGMAAVKGPVALALSMARLAQASVKAVAVSGFTATRAISRR